MAPLVTLDTMDFDYVTKKSNVQAKLEKELKKRTDKFLSEPSRWEHRMTICKINGRDVT